LIWIGAVNKAGNVPLVQGLVDTWGGWQRAVHCSRVPCVLHARHVNCHHTEVLRSDQCFHLSLSFISALAVHSADGLCVRAEAGNPHLHACHFELCLAVASQHSTPSHRILLLAHLNAEEGVCAASTASPAPIAALSAPGASCAPMWDLQSSTRSVGTMYEHAVAAPLCACKVRA